MNDLQKLQGGIKSMINMYKMRCIATDNDILRCNSDDEEEELILKRKIYERIIVELTKLLEQ